MKQIKLYGKDTEGVNQGQHFIAVIGEVEGRKVVTLKAINKVWSD